MNRFLFFGMIIWGRLLAPFRRREPGILYRIALQTSRVGSVRRIALIIDGQPAVICSGVMSRDELILELVQFLHLNEDQIEMLLFLSLPWERITPRLGAAEEMTVH